MDKSRDDVTGSPLLEKSESLTSELQGQNRAILRWEPRGDLDEEPPPETRE